MNEEIRAQLFACPWCQTSGFTALGLRQHLCKKAPDAPGEPKLRTIGYDQWLRVIGRERAPHVVIPQLGADSLTREVWA